MSSKSFFEEYLENDSVLFARIADLPDYQATQADIKSIENFGTKKNISGLLEGENFKVRKNGKVYGFVETMTNNNRPRRIGFENLKQKNSKEYKELEKRSSIENCLIIFVTHDSSENGCSEICGFYRNAKIYRERQYAKEYLAYKDEMIEFFGGDEEVYKIQYNFETDDCDAILLSNNQRLKINTKKDGLNFGQSNIKYVDNNNREQVAAILDELYDKLTTNDYQNFFKMMKFWIKQTDKNIENTGGRIPKKDIKEENKNEAEVIFTDPKFNKNFLQYTDFKIKLSFISRNNYKSEKVNYIVWENSGNNGLWLNIQYLYDKKEVRALFNPTDKLEDPHLKEAMEKRKFNLGLSFSIEELDLESEVPNESVKKLYDYFYEMIRIVKLQGYGKEKKRVLNELSEKVKQSRNIVFHGAPGTGKTYLAKEIAAEIVSNGRTQDITELNEEEQERIGFVQFHPSYDYTDFVEGLRPIIDEVTQQVGFELRAGIFKEFCTKAIEAKRIGGVDNFDEAWESFFEEVNNIQNDDPSATYDIKTLTYKKTMHLQSYVRGGMEGVWEFEKRGNYYNKEQCRNIYHGLPGVPRGGLDNYRKAIVQHLKDVYGLKDYELPKDNIHSKPYVFIIDEINRGEISKIFGELFYSIDPSYRGKNGAVLTQYANLHENPNELFFIPDNVYLIGTMNDIDRSVDSLDFAMRRRFRFIKLKANEQLGMLASLGDNREEATNRMINLNAEISNVDELNDNYHIGASYFLKLESGEITFDELWEDYLSPLLQDYVRGMYEEVEIMKNFKDAYKMKKNNQDKIDETTSD